MGAMGRPSIAHRARRAAWKVGIDVHPLRADDTARRRAAVLANNGITLAVDGGANEGAYGLALREAGYRGGIVSFEPLSAPFARLTETARGDSLWECRQLALGDRCDTVTMNVSDQDQVSSTLRPVEQHAGWVGAEQVEVVTIDSLNLQGTLALKLDLEGYEPQALDGAKQTLPNVRVIEVELGMRPPYKGCGWREMLNRLEAEGFTLAGIEPGFTDWGTGRVWEADALLERAT